MLGADLRDVDHGPAPGAVGEIDPGLLVEPRRALGQGEGLAVAVTHLVLATRLAPAGVVAAEVPAFDGAEMRQQNDEIVVGGCSRATLERSSRFAVVAAALGDPASSNNANGRSASMFRAAS